MGLFLNAYFIFAVATFRQEILEQEAQGFVVVGFDNTEAGPSAVYAK